MERRAGLIENRPISPVSVVFFNMLWIEEGVAATSDPVSAYALIMLVVGLSPFLPTEFVEVEDKPILSDQFAACPRLGE